MGLDVAQSSFVVSCFLNHAINSESALSEIDCDSGAARHIRRRLRRGLPNAERHCSLCGPIQRSGQAAMLTRSQIGPDSPSYAYTIEPAPPRRSSPPRSPSYAYSVDATVDSRSETCSTEMKRATCARASRAARACEPSLEALAEMASITTKRLCAFAAAGIQRAPAESAFRDHRAGVSCGGKGPGVRTLLCEQPRMNHIASLKAKDLDTTNSEPAFLLGGEVAALAWDRLAESSIKANAVNSSVLGRRKTQGARPHTLASQHSICANSNNCCFLCRGGEPGSLLDGSIPERIPFATSSAPCQKCDAHSP